MKAEAGYVYAIGATGHRAVKIGWAANPDKRLRDLQCGCPLPLALLWAFPVDDAQGVERFLHRRFHRQRMQGEWFDLGPDGALVARQEFAQVTGRPDLAPEPEPPFVPVMAEHALHFLADIHPWVMAVPKFARHVTVEHLHQQLQATGIPRWQEERGDVKVGRILSCLFGSKFYTPTRQYPIGTVRVRLIREAAQQFAAGNEPDWGAVS